MLYGQWLETGTATGNRSPLKLGHLAEDALIDSFEAFRAGPRLSLSACRASRWLMAPGKRGVIS